MQTNLSKARQKLIDDLEKEKLKRFKRAQKRLVSMILAYVTENIETEDGAIKQIASNYAKINALDILQREFEEKYMSDILKWFARSAARIIAANETYFNFASDIVKRRTAANAYNRFGATATGAIKKGGILSNICNTSKVIGLVKNVAVRGIANRQPLREYQKEIERFIIPDDKKGLLETELLEKSQDLFSIIDRETGNNYAVELGLNYAIYQGGIIRTSRPFCLERNNKVYSKKEIESWATLDFQGKSEPYNPFVDCGGYNCRHQLDWISDELAYRLRPDLKKNLLNEG